MNFTQMRRLTIEVLIFLLAFSPTAQGQETDTGRGTLEYGVVAGGLSYPTFPSATTRKNRVLVLPYIKYKGSRFSLGGSSIAAVHLASGARVKLDLSLAGSFDASSAGVPVRVGMPDLDFIFEAGPVLEYQLGSFLGGTAQARIPLRGVFTTNFKSITAIGATFSPQLRITWMLNPSTRTELEATLQPVFATEGVQDYFYQVDALYATVPRPAFNARGGYMGSELVVTLSHSFSTTLRVYAYGKLGMYGGATNSASPLFGDTRTTTIGIALRKTIGFKKFRYN